MTQPVDTREVQLTPKLKVGVRTPTEEQAAVVFKTAKAAQRDPGANGLQALDVLFRVVEKLLVDPDDGPRIDDALLDGEIGISDILKLFAQGGNDADETAPRRVRRARPAAKR